MQKSSVPSINLAKNRGETFVDRFLKWALTIGRVLVIVTEAAALGAFLYRFGLDRQLVDLHDRIKQEQAIVKLLKDNETTYRNIQDRIDMAKTISDGSNQQVKMFKDINSYMPSDMSVTSLTFSNTTAHIDASVLSLTSLSSFINKLKVYPSIDKVSLDKLENRASAGSLKVSITIFFNKNVAKKLL